MPAYVWELSVTLSANNPMSPTLARAFAGAMAENLEWLLSSGGYPEHDVDIKCHAVHDSPSTDENTA